MQDRKKINKSIIMMLLLTLLLIGATYAWLISVTHTDITGLNFIADDNITVTFWGYNATTGAFDIPIMDGDLKLKGMKPGDSKTVRIKMERYSPQDKGLYIKLLGVEAVGSDGGEPYSLEVGGSKYNISSFISADIRTPDTNTVSGESITVTGQPIPFDMADHESILDILELVQGYPWPTDGTDYEVKYLDLVIHLLETRSVTGGSISIMEFQKQKVVAGNLNVQAVNMN